MENCKVCKKPEGNKVELVVGVQSTLCHLCKGQYEADLIAALKSYGFRAATSAPDTFDEIKDSVI